MENQKSCLEIIAPRKFCCSIELKTGLKCVGVLLAVILAACTVGTVVQTLDLRECKSCPSKAWKHAYAYSVSTSVYCGLMCLVNLWFIWAVEREQKSVVMAWVVISAVWLAQTSCLLMVLIFKYDEEVGHVAWAVSFTFCIIVILLLAYFVFAGYGYWLQLRNKRRLQKSAIKI